MGTAEDGRAVKARASKLADVIDTAKAEFEGLTGRAVESVSCVRRSEDGWTVYLEAVELERVPASTSILGTYEAQVDSAGSMLEYERIRRYHRNQPSEQDL